jgi:hypothetical protein
VFADSRRKITDKTDLPAALASSRPATMGTWSLRRCFSWLAFQPDLYSDFDRLFPSVHVKIRSIAEYLPPAFDSGDDQIYGTPSHFTSQQIEDGKRIDELKLSADEEARKYLFNAEEEVDANRADMEGKPCFPSSLAGVEGPRY